MANEKKQIGTDPVYDATLLGIPRMLILGFQHMFAMFGATVLVPIIVSGDFGLPLSVQTTLFFAGFGTIFFHLCTKLKVPAFLGSSFAYLGGFATIGSLDVGKWADMTGEEKLPYALGGICIAGLLYLILALLFKVVGPQKVMRFFPPIVTGPMIILIGLSLAGSAVTNASTNWPLALVAIVGRGMKNAQGTAGRLCTALANAGVNIKMIDQGSSELNIIVGVRDEDFERTIRAIYREFIEKDNK